MPPTSSVGATAPIHVPSGAPTSRCARKRRKFIKARSAKEPAAARRLKQLRALQRLVDPLHEVTAPLALKKGGKTIKAIQRANQELLRQVRVLAASPTHLLSLIDVVDLIDPAVLSDFEIKRTLKRLHDDRTNMLAWRETHDVMRLLTACWFLHRYQGCIYSLNLGPAIEARAANAENSASYLLKRIMRSLGKTSAAGAQCFVAVHWETDSGEARLHVHGGILTSVSKAVVRGALLEAAGEWDNPKGRCFQVHVDFLNKPAGWAEYCRSELAPLQESPSGFLAMTRSLKRSTRETYEALRRLYQRLDQERVDREINCVRFVGMGGSWNPVSAERAPALAHDDDFDLDNELVVVDLPLPRRRIQRRRAVHRQLLESRRWRWTLVSRHRVGHGPMPPRRG